jgi:antitoxin MazE
MIVNVIQIGNSKGIRIPATILSQCNIESEVDLEIENNRIVLIPISNKPRKNWSDQFKQMAKNNNDSLLIDDSLDIDLDTFEW